MFLLRLCLLLSLLMNWRVIEVEVLIFLHETRGLITVLQNPSLLLLMQVKVNLGVEPRALPYRVPLFNILD